jgi:lysophospholipase L1-like esterase
MVVGDSISHGQEGDYTWRFRLAQWAADTSQNLKMTYVGPYKGTNPVVFPSPPAPAPLQGQSPPSNAPDFTNGAGYAAGIGSEWDTGHFAAWGRQVAEDKSRIQQMVAAYQPDILLVELGFNDIGWFVSDAMGALQSMEQLVSNARAIKADIKIAIANIPQRTYLNGRDDLVANTNQYNDLLKSAITAWTQAGSPIGLVDLYGSYSCTPNGGCPAAYDGLHPNELGEYQIAAAFSRTMASSFGIGRAPLTIPAVVPTRPTPVPSGFQALSGPLGIQVSVSNTSVALSTVPYIRGESRS